MMMYFTGLRCVHCGRAYNTDEADYFCASCGYHDGILDVLYDYDAMRKELNPATLAANSDRSMWRYLPLLPVADRTLIPHSQQASATPQLRYYTDVLQLDRWSAGKTSLREPVCRRRCDKSRAPL